MTIPLPNAQVPEKQNRHPDGLLDVHSVLYTLQGEGPFTGIPAVFVRLAGCNLQCNHCDSDYTTGRRFMSVFDLCDKVVETFVAGKPDLSRMKTPPLVVITGGEPFRQDFAEFVRKLKTTYSVPNVQIETNGTLCPDDFPFPAVTVVCSPKTPKIAPGLETWVRHFKYVVEAGQVDPMDGLPLSVLGNGLRPFRPWPSFRGTVWVQPADEQDEIKNRANREIAVEVCMRFGYRMCLQTHKLLGLE